MARTGRPPLPEAERLSEPLHVRLSRPTFDALDRRARAERKELRVLVREILSAVSEPKKIRIGPPV